MNKKLMFALVLIAVFLTAAFASVSNAEAENFNQLSLGHPILKWNSDNTVLLDVQYKVGVGYAYEEIESAFYTFAKQACGNVGEAKCWYGSHVGILKNTLSTPPEVAGFYYNQTDGMFYLIDVGNCLEADGCVK